MQASCATESMRTMFDRVRAVAWCTSSGWGRPGSIANVTRAPRFFFLRRTLIHDKTRSRAMVFVYIVSMCLVHLLRHGVARVELAVDVSRLHVTLERERVLRKFLVQSTILLGIQSIGACARSRGCVRRAHCAKTFVR